MNGATFEAIYETSAGPVWVSAAIEIVEADLVLKDLLVYSATSSRLLVGTREMLEIFRSMEKEAFDQGFRRCKVEAERIYDRRPARTITFVRRLR